ncbi:MAG: ATP-binding protein [Planctomycetes bacterium]|nr:ATP-binding protein [Planctomycetota bacterium]
MEALRHQICVQADPRRLGELREQLFQICSAEDVPAHTARLLVLAIDEAISNVIEHGQLNESDKIVDLSMEIDPERIVAEICDRGKPFDPTSARPEPDTSSHPRRGFGLYLIHKIVDEIHYTRTDDGHNVLTLTKEVG